MSPLPVLLAPLPLTPAAKFALVLHSRGLSQARLRGHVGADLAEMAIWLVNRHVLATPGGRL